MGWKSLAEISSERRAESCFEVLGVVDIGGVDVLLLLGVGASAAMCLAIRENANCGEMRSDSLIEDCEAIGLGRTSFLVGSVLLQPVPYNVCGDVFCEARSLVLTGLSSSVPSSLPFTCRLRTWRARGASLLLRLDDTDSAA